MNADVMIEAVLDRVADLLHRRIGLRCEATMRDRLRRAVHEEVTARATGLTEYPDLLLAEETAFQALLNRITVQETSFFRHADHFTVLANHILPSLRPPVRVWSAGCSNGQEAYSIAMVLAERQVDGSVIATDLSTAALRRTTEARYTSRELSGLSTDQRERWLVPAGQYWQIAKPLRDRVTVFRHNLVDPIPERVRDCQIVFCRNVLIYFTPEQARDFLDRLADVLVPGSCLFLGTAETIWQVSDRFVAVKLSESFVHRTIGPNADPRPPAAPPTQRTEPPSGRRGDPGRRPVARTIAGDGGRGASVPAARSPSAQPEQRQDRVAQAERAAQAGQMAAAAGDARAAVVAFRKWTYLVPEDAMAHLHLGLAFERTGDLVSARRSFAAARHALLTTDQADIEHALGGYSPGELLKFLDAKEQEGRP